MFSDLGLRPGLVRAAEEAGFAGPTPLQEATIPVLRRGANAVVEASSGAGVTAAVGLPLLDRLAEVREGGEGERLLALVLAPTEDAASRLAEALAPFALAEGLRVAAQAPGWAPAAGADIVVSTPARALEGVQTSALKLDGLEALVVMGASSLFALGGAEALDTLTASVPREAQRVLVALPLTREVEDYAERHVRKALRIPPRAAEEGAGPETTGSVAYLVVGEEEKLPAAARIIAESTDTVVFSRTDERAADIAEALANRGFRIGALGEPETDVVVAAATAPPEEMAGARPLSVDVPFDAAQLRGRHAERGGVVLVLPRELPHLQRIAREAALAVLPRRGAAPAAGALEAFRRRVAQAAREEDLAAQLLVLDPLFDEFSPAEVAAAASALLRKRAAAAEPRAAEPARAARTPAAPPAYVRLFISVGQRDNVRAGDLVGAIAGEAGLSGDQIGRIDVRDTFSIVEVPGEAGDRVIRALNGTTLRGRSVRVDYDRKRTGGAGPREGGREGGRPAGPRRPGAGRARRE
ncbi:MAG TPA: DEAD/DEAH box helicase [Longimicrobiales bacterium]|nr:DEAD/DEAH box helicase [Longimicrobiales bacterium]